MGIITAYVLIFFALLWLEWKRQAKSLRLIAASLALALVLFNQPGYTRAARRAMMAAPAERVTQIRGDTLSEYISGVRTMEQAVGEDANAGATARIIGFGVLLWLACSPVLRHSRLGENQRPRPDIG